MAGVRVKWRWVVISSDGDLIVLGIESSCEAKRDQSAEERIKRHAGDELKINHSQMLARDYKMGLEEIGTQSIGWFLFTLPIAFLT